MKKTVQFDPRAELREERHEAARVAIVRVMVVLVVVTWALGPLPTRASAQAGVPANPDLSQCDNCDDFPDAWLDVDQAELIDLAALPPERRLDFFIGEWELLFPAEIPDQGIHWTEDQPVGFELVDWFVDQKVLEGFQEWPFTGGGSIPFRAKTDFRYIAEEDRWQMTWLTNGSSGVYTGGLEEGGVIAFYEHEMTGDRRAIDFQLGMRYVFRNITADRFIAESYFASDDGQTFDLLQWRLLYRRRTAR